MSTAQNEDFQSLFHYPVVVDFAYRAVTTGYTECAPGYEALMHKLLDRAFQLLVDARDDPQQFQAAVGALSSQVFRKQDPDFWFNRVYRHYKEVLKPQIRKQKLAPWIQGKRLLDFGCGDGLTSKALQETGCQPLLCDVLDYRNPAASDLPFVQMTDPRRIPYPDCSADTAIVMAVFHHVAAPDLPILIKELKRVSRRLIVEEDSYGVPEDVDGLSQVLERDQLLKEFMGLALEDQRRYLMFIDYFANAITQGLSQMDMPFNFKTVPEWQALFENQGMIVRKILPMGFQPRQFNRSCHIWFVLDSNH